jgi:transcription elongation factor Elf1
MPCPTCDHTMSAIDMLKDEKGNAFGLFHCPRCGTLKKVFSFHEETFIPTLVTRCRSLFVLHGGRPKADIDTVVLNNIMEAVFPDASESVD